MQEPKDRDAELVRRFSRMTPASIARIPLAERFGRPGKIGDVRDGPKAEKPSDEKDLK